MMTFEEWHAAQDPSDQKLKNLRQWAKQVERSYEFCKLCGYPLPPRNETVCPTDRCDVCITLDVTLCSRTYWIQLNSKHKEGLQEA